MIFGTSMLLPLSATYITDIQASLNGRFIVSLTTRYLNSLSWSANASPVHGRWLRNGHCQSLLYSAIFVRLPLFLNQVCLALSTCKTLSTMSTSTTCIHSGSFRLLPLLSVVGSTHHSAFLDVNLNSSMMFSSLFAVVQSSEPRCPQCLAWATLTSQSCVQFLLLTFLFTQPSSVPFQCRAWSLGTSSGCALYPSAPSFWT